LSLIECVLEDFLSDSNEANKSLFHAKLNEFNKRLVEKPIQEVIVHENIDQPLNSSQNDLKNTTNPFLSEEEDDEYFWDDELSFAHNENVFSSYNSNADESSQKDRLKERMIEKICESQIKIAKLNEEKDFLENNINELTCNLEQKKRYYLN
jgi:hypothetical protein